ncbi:MAG: hypothetical protein ACKVXR_05340 [Planctomycetota bacterium]
MIPVPALLLFALCTSADAQTNPGRPSAVRGRVAPGVTPPPYFNCTVVGPDRTCGGGAGIIYSATITPPTAGLTYSWSLSTATVGGCPGTGTTNPSFCGPTNGPTVCVLTGNNPGRFVLSLFATNGYSEANCCLSINVTPTTEASALVPAIICPGQTNQFCTTATGTAPFTYVWEKDGVVIPGATSSCYTASAGAPNSTSIYCVAVTGSGTCGTTYWTCAPLTTLSEVAITPIADVLICEGTTHQFCTTATGSGPLTYSWTKNGAVIPGATGSCYTAAAGVPGVVDEYCVTVAGACNTVTDCAFLRTQANTSVTTQPATCACPGAINQFCAVVTGVAPFTFSWTQNGVPIPGATNQCYNATTPASGVTDSYCVTVTGLCGPPSTACTSLCGNFLTTATPIGSFSGCPGAPAGFCTNAGGTGPFTFVWTKNAVVIPGATTNCISTTIPAQFAPVDTYCVTVTGACGAVQQCGTLDGIECFGGAFSTLTQATFGDAASQYNGVNSPDLVEQLLLPGAVTIGMAGANSLTLTAGGHDSQCVTNLLPVSGVRDTLPGFGDETLEPDCQTVPIPLPILNGKFENILLGEVVTLSLNLKLADGMTTGSGVPTIPVDLSSQGVCKTMVSRTILPGADGLMGTADDVADLNGPDGDPATPDNLLTLTVSDAVIASLNELGLTQTVGGVLALGNLALAGQPTWTATIDEISSAVDGMNLIFEAGREIVDIDCSQP